MLYDLLTGTTPAMFVSSVGRARRLWQTRVFMNQSNAKHLARAVRPVPIKIITVTKGNSKGTSLLAGNHLVKICKPVTFMLTGNISTYEIAEEWADKLRRYTQVTALQLKPNPKRSRVTAAAVQSEGQLVLRNVSPNDRVILLDERGTSLTSEKFAQIIAQVSFFCCSASMFPQQCMNWTKV